MLVITRRRGETFRISGPARVEIIDWGRHKVKVGITADPSVVIERDDIVDARPKYTPQRSTNNEQ